METHPRQDPKTLGHEPLGANVRAVWQTGAGLAAVVVVSFLLVAGLMKYFAAVDNVSPGKPVSAQVPMAPGVPILNPHQPVELRDLRQRERRLLASYGWIDRATGIARIPIDRAMQIVATEGLPATPRSAAADRQAPAGSEPP
jgi:hypothetical protein